jgi:hypothetical protein
LDLVRRFSRLSEFEALTGQEFAPRSTALTVEQRRIDGGAQVVIEATMQREVIPSRSAWPSAW